MPPPPDPRPVSSSHGAYGRRYFAGHRLHSLAHQVRALVESGAERVLEVGPASGLATLTLRHLGLHVVTVDVDAALRPDVTASVEALPFAEDAFDAATCCQVLEHLPFARFGLAVRELRRVAREALVLSLPDATRHVEVSLRLPRLGRRALGLGLPRLWDRRPGPAQEAIGHRWEIGYAETPLRAVKAELRAAGWRLRRTWRTPEFPWHRFFLLD